MTDPMPPAALAEIAARHKATGTGTWFREQYADGERMPDGSGGIDGWREGRKVLSDEDGGPLDVADCDDEDVADFLLHAHNTDIPRLLAEVERLEAENARLRDAERIAWAMARGYVSGGRAHASISRRNGSACWHFNMRGKDIILGAGEHPDFEQASDPNLMRATIDAAIDAAKETP